MSKTATTRSNDAIATHGTLFVAFELGERKWRLAWAPSLDRKPKGATLRARDTGKLLEVLEQARQRAGATRLTSCYEAGRDGFWLHRFLHAHGIDNRIVDAASIEVNRRARRRKTDRLDARKLLTMLLREALGEQKVWSVARLPSVEDEDARSLQREYRTLVKERTRSANRIQGLLASHGLAPDRVDAKLPAWIASVRLWDGSSLPVGARARILREFERWRFTHPQILAIEKERRERMKSRHEKGLEKVRSVASTRSAASARARPGHTASNSSRGATSATAKRWELSPGSLPLPTRAGTWSTSWAFAERATAGSEDSRSRLPGAGCATSPTARSRGGTRSASRGGGLRARNVGIVALARELLVALWRYVETGVIPEGATLKA